MPRCPYGKPHPNKILKDKYVVRVETSLQELSAKALLKAGIEQYYVEPVFPTYRCACDKHDWMYRGPDRAVFWCTTYT